MLTSGHLLADRYRLGRRIAVGGMGEVWEAEDARLDRRVAVKVLKAELCGDAEFLHRFRAEARTTASLNHPGVAGVHDYGETAAAMDGRQNTAYLVMELVEGEPLAAILARDKRMSAERTLDMLEQAGHALQAAHTRGLVHRDIKPGNILLTPTGMVKLTDFGIAKAADAAPVTRSGMVMGTAHYIAPEQAVGEKAAPASDVYSLAVVGYECLCGHRPFLSDNAVTVAMMHIRDLPPPLPPDVPHGVRALIEATLVKDPRQRYGTGGEFAAAVAAVRAGRPLPTPSGYTPPATMAAHTPPTGMTALSPPSGMPGGMAQGGMTQTGPNTPGGPNTPAGMLPAQPVRQRSNAWLWVLFAVMVVTALVLTIWGVVASSASGAPGTGPTTRTATTGADQPAADQEDPRSAPGSPEAGPGGGFGQAPGPAVGTGRDAGDENSGSARTGGSGDAAPTAVDRRDRPPVSAGGESGTAVPEPATTEEPGGDARGIAPSSRDAPAPEAPFPPTSVEPSMPSSSDAGYWSDAREP
jgi:serine/threonine-protein kinase